MEVTTTALNAYNEATKEETLPKKRGRKPKIASDEVTEPKKRGRKPKNATTEEPKKKGHKKITSSESETVENTAEKDVNTEEKPADAVILVDNEKPAKKSSKGGWSTDNGDLYNGLCKHYMYVEIQLMRKALGMMPNDPELLSTFIASKAPDAKSREDEIAMYGIDKVEEDSTTVWPVTDFIIDKEHDILIDKHDWSAPEAEGEEIRAPFIYDYQLRGMFKDSCGLLSRAKNNKSSELRAYKKIVDGNIFVFPRHVAFEIPEEAKDEFGRVSYSYDENGKLKRFQRSLRASTPQGEITALASSEYVPAGSTLKFKIGMTSKIFEPFVREWLNYGAIHGIGQWRNSGVGIYRWRELDEEWNPL